MKFDVASLLKKRTSPPVDVVGVDLGATGVKAVRLRRTGTTISLAAAAVLPAVPRPGAGERAPAPLLLPKALRARHVALALSSPDAVVKLLVAPCPADRVGELDFQELLGLGDATGVRIGYEVLRGGDGRSETPVMAAAIPEIQARWACQLFPAGIPAPCSVEVAGLAALACFLRGPGGAAMEGGVMSVEFGAEVCMVAAFANGHPVIVRQLALGENDVTRKIRESLGVDEATARGILESGSVDVSRPIRTALDSLLRQLVVARDFVERRFNCGVQRLFVDGGAAEAKHWREAVGGAVDLAPETWNPLAVVPALPGAIPVTLQGMETRFAAAMGAALGVLDEETK